MLQTHLSVHLPREPFLRFASRETKDATDWEFSCETNPFWNQRHATCWLSGNASISREQKLVAPLKRNHMGVVAAIPRLSTKEKCEITSYLGPFHSFVGSTCRGTSVVCGAKDCYHLYSWYGSDFFLQTPSKNEHDPKTKKPKTMPITVKLWL